MIALDLFAGHGWGVACQKLGIEEYGVEIMPEAIATRELNGMTTVYRDVWEGLAEDRPLEERHPVTYGDYDLLIASPPCQTFSMAGGGAGRKALDDVLGLIDAKAYRSVEDLRAFGESHDPRTALVLTPLAHVFRDLPRYVVLEQVPPVLPVWERCAEEMRAWGYSVWTGNLQSEMYGVPQTRKRAILIAKRDPDLDGEAAPPVPTHSRYYSRDPKRLDAGVLPWVSMAEALGWGMTERPMVTAGNAVDRAEGVGGSGAKAAIEREKARGAWLRSNYGTGGDPAARGERTSDEPSATVTSKIDRNRWEGRGAWGFTERPIPTLTTGSNGGGSDPQSGGSGSRKIVSDARAAGTYIDPAEGPKRVTVDEAAALQSYPADFRWDAEITDPKTGRMKPITKTNQFLQVGNAVPPLLAEAILQAVIS